MGNTITAVVPSFRRHANLPVIIDRIRNQTHKPERIIVWNDNSGKYGEDVHFDGDDIIVVNTNTNLWKDFGSLVVGYLTDTDYVTRVDDDMPPGRKWFEWCVSHQEDTPGNYGYYGVTLNNKGSYQGNTHIRSKIGNDELVQVDSVGNSWFYPIDSLCCMLRERPFTFRSVTDLHHAFMSQKYGGYKCYVPFPSDEEALPCHRWDDLPFGTGDRAMWQDEEHYVMRNKYVRWAVRNGWKLVNFD